MTKHGALTSHITGTGRPRRPVRLVRPTPATHSAVQSSPQLGRRGQGCRLAAMPLVNGTKETSDRTIPDERQLPEFWSRREITNHHDSRGIFFFGDRRLGAIALFVT